VFAVYNTIEEKMLQQVIALSSDISLNVKNIKGLNPGIFVLRLKTIQELSQRKNL